VLHALECFTRQLDNITVGKVTAEVGLSRRRLIEIFTEQIGMTPKIFCRVRRFQRAINEIQRRRALPWTEIATGCGYYDQAHFINDFREFCGITPGDYAGENPEYPNFVPIRE
jgi:AraC-like DNA-binding protein